MEFALLWNSPNFVRSAPTAESAYHPCPKPHKFSPLPELPSIYFVLLQEPIQKALEQ